MFKITKVAGWTLMVLGLSFAAAQLGSQARAWADGPDAKLTPTVSRIAFLAGLDDCSGVLQQAVKALPAEPRVTWGFAELDDLGAAGVYRLERNHIEIDLDLDCHYVAHVAAHEWAHAVQDAQGQDWGMGVRADVELTAECAARRVSDTHGWLTFDSYPESQGRSCSVVQAQVDALLGRGVS